jgi:hypothetical protein
MKMPIDICRIAATERSTHPVAMTKMVPIVTTPSMDAWRSIVFTLSNAKKVRLLKNAAAETRTRMR